LVVIVSNFLFSFFWSWADRASRFYTTSGLSFSNPTSTTKNVRYSFTSEI
jgi:hypothetical protein